MDFSLLQSHSRHRFLRDILALKSRWPYYFIMIIDPILRFAWIFYAIFTHDTQHSTIVSFLVAFTEVVRRGMWILFRVENEHCANVSQYKASRDVPLPYRIEPLVRPISRESTSPTLVARESSILPQTASNADPESLVMSGSSTAVASSGTSANLLRRRNEGGSGGLAKFISKMLAEAHKQDFVKRRKPADPDVRDEDARAGHESDGDDDSQSGGDDDSGGDEEDDEDGENEMRNQTESTEAHDLSVRGRD